MKPWHAVTAVAFATALCGCVNLAPKYVRPASPVPATWAQGYPSSTGAGSVQDLGWRDVYTDPRLARVISQALANNRDLRIAVLDIEKARAEYREQGAELFPTIAVTASQTASRSPVTSTAAATGNRGVLGRTDAVELGFSSYELDLFGRLRNLSDEAKDAYLGSIETRRSTQISLIAQVATAWFQLAADQRLLALSRRMLASQQQTRELVGQQHALGAVSALDDAQAEEALQAYRGDVASYEASAARDRDALDLLVGAPVSAGDLPGDAMDVAVRAPPVPARLDSDVLLQRPDIVAAEEQLKAADADIGAARADFFPQVTLTAADGTASHGLHGLFKAGSHAWSFSPTISLPLFDDGARRGALDEAKAEQGIQVATYEKAVQTAFSEVADALAERAVIDEQMDANEKAVAAAQKSYELAQAMYQQGAYSLLDVLTIQRTLYTDRQAQVNVHLADATSASTLYKALGGGWDDSYKSN